MPNLISLKNISGFQTQNTVARCLIESHLNIQKDLSEDSIQRLLNYIVKASGGYLKSFPVCPFTISKILKLPVGEIINLLILLVKEGILIPAGTSSTSHFINCLQNFDLETLLHCRLNFHQKALNGLGEV